MNDSGPSGDELHGLLAELYPICRSITGDGVRRTLDLLSRVAPLKQTEVPTGSQVLDWTVPREWNIRDAYIKDPSGQRIVDFQQHTLHVVNYSLPIRATLSLEELKPHLHSLPEQPDLIPYRTSYYADSWGFCLSHAKLEALRDVPYEVCIDATLEPGALTYGQCVIPGRHPQEVLISAHVCHPSLCNDNLSGLSIAAHLARELLRGPTPRYTYRFLFAPGTIGAITWLAQHRETARNIKHGLTLTCLGDASPFTYKRTYQGTREIDRVAAQVLKHSGYEYQEIEFFPYGYDERQYNSPGFRLPVGSLMRGRHGEFPEYHTSGDNLDFVQPDRLRESYCVLEDVVELLEANSSYRNLQPYAEPQLGRRGLYSAVGGHDIPDLQLAMLWMLNMSDGDHSLLDVAERSGLGFRALAAAAQLLVDHQLLAVVDTA